jgi:glycosyltransferase involved in cell wall biosynthesis
MSLFLIKTGKAINVLKQDGFLNGVKRIMSALRLANKKVKPGDVLIITNGFGDSALYRAYHVAEELNFNGIKCSVTVQDNPSILKFSEEFKIFIFHRTLDNKTTQKLVEKIKSQKKEIIFEADDLVYDPKFLKLMDGYKEINFLEKKMYKNGLGGDILTDPYTKVCTTTTTFLAEKFKEEKKKVSIIPNKLSKEDVSWAKEILKNKKEKSGDEFMIGYFSGTISHNKDFATITQPLTEILEKYPQVKIFLAGPLAPEDTLVNKFRDRVINTPYVLRKEYFKNIALVDICIAPLEIGNSFCEGKSELKFFEAGIFKIPTVASATQTFSEAIKDGEDGFVAKNDREWKEKLEMLILDKKLRVKMGEAAYKKTLEKYTTKNAKNETYYEFLKSKIKQ